MARLLAIFSLKAAFTGTACLSIVKYTPDIGTRSSALLQVQTPSVSKTALEDRELDGFGSAKVLEREPGELEQEPSTVSTAPRPYTILTAFVGRRDRFPILAEYLRLLVEQGDVNELHFWDYTETDEDRMVMKETAYSLGARFLNPASAENRGINSSKWAAYYHFYATAFHLPKVVAPDDAVIVKVDDDIVYIDTDRFQDFVETAARRTDMFAVHANIVNSGVSAYYQQQHGALSHLNLEYPVTDGQPGGMGSLVTHPDMALSLHRQFLEHPKAFAWEGDCIVYHHPNTTLFPAQGRTSINFMAVRVAAWKTVWQLVQGAHGGNHDRVSDEVMLTTGATASGLHECIVPFFNVVHLSFSSQHSIDPVVLPWYWELLLSRLQQG